MKTATIYRQIVAWLGCLFFVAFMAGCASGELPEGTVTEGDEDTGISDQEDVGVVDDGGESDDAGDVDDTDTGQEEGCELAVDCPAGEVCVRPSVDSAGQCEVVEDGGVEGDSCVESSDCDTGLCLDGVCSRPCESFSHCLDGWTCSDDGLCEAPSCAHDGNCAEGQWCAVAANDDAGALETVCLPDNGGVEDGQNCEEHDQCLGRYCLNGECTAPCQNPDQCSGTAMCETLEIEKEGLEGTFELCQSPMSIECSAPEDCGGAELSCNMPTYDGDYIDGATCGPTNPGQAGLGEDCTQNSGCESNLCLPSGDGTNGQCSVFCQTTSSHCGVGQVCLGIDTDVGICAPTCDRNADCAGNDICRFGLETSGQLVRFCDAPVGDGELGDECDMDTDCESGLCLGTYTDQACSTDANCPGDFRCLPCPQGVQCSGSRVCQLANCSAVCASDTDCSGTHGMTECAHDIVMTIDGGQQETVSACAWP